MTLYAMHIFSDTVRNFNGFSSECPLLLLKLNPNKARRGHICPPVQKWQNIAYLGGKSPHVNISKTKYVHDGHFDTL